MQARFPEFLRCTAKGGEDGEKGPRRKNTVSISGQDTNRVSAHNTLREMFSRSSEMLLQVVVMLQWQVFPETAT